MLRATAVAIVLMVGATAAEARRPSRSPRDRLGAAFVAYQAGDLERAKREIDGLAPERLENPDYLWWLRGQIALLDGRPDAAAAAFQTLAAIKTSRFAGDAAWRLADCKWEAGDRGGAAREYARLAGMPGAEDHADLGVASFRMASAKTGAAQVSSLRHFLVAFPGHPMAGEAERMLARAGAVTWSADDRIERSQRLTAAHQWDAAVAELMLVPDAVPDAVRVRRDYWLGETFFKMRRRYGDAGALLLSVAPKMDSAEALFHGARALSRADHDDDAIRWYRQVVARYPRTAFAEEAQYLTGWLEFNRGNYQAAIAPLEETIRRYPKSKWMDDALWFLGMSHYLNGHYDRALPVLEQLARRGASLEGGKGRYWWARTVDRLGRHADALGAYRSVVARWPFSWYALLSAARLREAGETIGAFGASPPAPRGPTVDATLDPAVEDDPAIRRFDELEQAGLDVDAGVELARAESGFVKRHGRSAALAVLFDRYGKGANWHRPWVLALAYDAGALDTPPEGPARFWWQHAYPEAYKDLVEKYQALGDNPPYYLYAIMRKESGYEPGVLSYADAQGLLQMIPPTTERVARKLGLVYGPGDLYAPETNIHTGSWYIGHLLAKFKRQIPLGAGSFNSGPRPVMKWIDQNGARPIDELVELVAYEQTREYMKKVTENYARYVYLYTGQVYEQPLTVDPAYVKDDLTY